MRYRQVHLDFHTSEHVPDVGGRFDKRQFQEALQLGHVDSVTIFSKCHHGWAYHPSKANKMHPTLTFDLLGAQIEAAHEIGVKTPVYLSAGFDEKIAESHSHWLRRREPDYALDFSVPKYHEFCLNTPYLDILLDQIKEVCENYDADGIFLDIVGVKPCYCDTCTAQLCREGKDPADAAAVLDLAERTYANFTSRVRAAIDSVKPGLPVFYNAGHIPRGRRDLAAMNSHLELESLPTGGWGYDNFPLTARYVQQLGMEYLGMTGKFHGGWGEFGGFKHPNALIYETALSIACGACCSIGDQLHPRGEMNESTYRLIGAAYAEVEKKEPWCVGAKNHADIAVLSCEAFLQSGRNGKGTDSNVGACRILLEGKFLFDFIDRETAFDGYKLIILPDLIRADDELTARLSDYIAKGGKVLLSGESGVKTDSDEFALNVGAKFAGRAAHQPNYMIPGFDCVNGKTSYVMYKPGYCLTDVTGEVFAESGESYFNRGPFFFSSHQHTPNDPAKTAPAAVISGNVAYIGWNVFEDYATIGELHMKELVLCALNRLLPEAERKVTTGLPDRGIVTAAKQGEREIVHLLFAYTTVRGKKTEIIEDAVPLYNVPVTLQVDAEPKKVSLVPSCEEIPFEYADGRVRFIVPEVTLHQMVCVE